MTLHFRISVHTTDNRSMKSDMQDLQVIRDDLKEQGFEYDMAETMTMCMDDIRKIFTELRDGKRQWLTIAVDGKEISIMHKAIAVVAVEVKGPAGNPYNAPVNWGHLDGVVINKPKLERGTL